MLESEPQQSFNSDPSTADAVASQPEESGGAAGLSYKFQRLREKLRAAIVSGEFPNKLPGERQLAKRFHVNAKTLSKALTDLAAEGLLDRSIGRGTFVKGSAPATAVRGRWLALCGPGGPDQNLVRELAAASLDVTFCADFGQFRPSFLTPFSAVLDLSSGAPDSIVRDLVVRNLPLIAVGHEPRTYAMHCVLPDVTLAAQKLGRDLLLSGQKRLVAVEAPGRTALTQALRTAAQRYAPDAVVDTCSMQEAATLLGDGAVAFVCDSAQAARVVRTSVAENATADVALAAVGLGAETDSDLPCSGYYVDCKQVVESISALLADPPPRPTTIWLNGQWCDRATMHPVEDVTSTHEPVERLTPAFAGMLA